LLVGTEEESLTDFVASQIHQKGLVYVNRKKGELTSIQDSYYDEAGKGQ
jgi:hypothetical protein